MFVALKYYLMFMGGRRWRCTPHVPNGSWNCRVTPPPLLKVTPGLTFGPAGPVSVGLTFVQGGGGAYFWVTPTLPFPPQKMPEPMLLDDLVQLVENDTIIEVVDALKEAPIRLPSFKGKQKMPFHALLKGLFCYNAHFAPLGCILLQ